MDAGRVEVIRAYLKSESLRDVAQNFLGLFLLWIGISTMQKGMDLVTSQVLQDALWEEIESVLKKPLTPSPKQVK